jgi:hypothetical protein
LENKIPFELSTTPIGVPSREEILEFMEKFFGYGDLSSPYWFVGLEESCEAKQEDFERRLHTWEALGRETTVDVAKFHYRFSTSAGENLFGRAAHLQKTWSQLIRIFLNATGDSPIDKSAILEYQKKDLARLGKKETCLLELRPLPSPGKNTFLYSECYPDIDELQSREIYENFVTPLRIKKFRELLIWNKPRVVVFYAFGEKNNWEQIVSPCRFDEKVIGGRRCYIGRGSNGILFIISQHPNTRGVTNEYFDEIGKVIKRELQAHPEND